MRNIPDRVTGTMPDGTPYVASDPHLLAWVHAAEVDSFLLAHQTYGARPLDAAGCDAYVAQAPLVAGKLGVVDPPTTVAELRAVLDDLRPELERPTVARDAVRFLVLHPDLPVAARPAYGVLMAAGVALMPRWTRRPAAAALAAGLRAHGRQGARHPGHRHHPLGDVLRRRGRQGAAARDLGLRASSRPLLSPRLSGNSCTHG